MFENSRRGKQARNFTTKVPKILDLKLSSEQIIIFRKLTLGVPELYERKRFSPITFLGKPTCNKPALPSQRLLQVFFCYSFRQSIFYSYNTLLSSQHPYYLNVFKTFDSTRSVMSALIFSVAICVIQGFWYFAEKKAKFRGISRGKFAEKSADFAGFSREKSQNSRKNRPISRDFRGRKVKIRKKIGRFRGILAEKSQISKDFRGKF